MRPYRLFSDRLRDAEKAGSSDVYQYSSVPPPTRVQIRQIAQSTFGNDRRRVTIWENNPAGAWAHKVYTHEKGRDHLGFSAENPQYDLLKFLESTDGENFVDVLEVICVSFLHIIGDTTYWKARWGAVLSPEAAIEQINFRLRDAGFGFQFENDRMVRVDSQFVHSEVVKPALTLLSRRGYEGPQAEFLAAHDHYRAGRHKEAITEAAKAFESLMKAVCDQKGWEYAKGARASDLIKILRTNKLWPTYLDASFDQLIATLSSGLPKVRNDDAAHGQGAVPTEVPDYVASYALHLAASKMVLIANAANS